MMRLSHTLFFMMSCSSLVSCGLWTPDYRDYTQQDDDDAVKTPDAGDAAKSPECAAALAEFTAQIEPAIDKVCVQCHESTTIGGTKFIAKNPTNNRKAVVAYAMGSADRFFNHFAQQNGERHGGGAQSSALAKTNVDAWFTKEAACK